MPTYPTFQFPGTNVQPNSAFAPAQVDFGRIGKLYDSYTDAQTNSMKRDAFQEQQAAGRDDRARQAEMRQAIAGAFKPGQTPDFQTLAAIASKYDPEMATDYMKMGSQERERAATRALDERKFSAEQAYRNQDFALRQTPDDVRKYQFYAKQERAAGRAPLRYDDWSRRPSVGTGKYGTTVQYTTDGRPWVTGNDGSVKFLDLNGATPLGPEGMAEAKATGAWTGKALAQGRMGLPKAEIALKQYQVQDKIVGETIDRAIAKANGWTTGFWGSAASKVPGTAAHDLMNTLNTIKANLGFDKLQAIRDASPTGGALGQVSEMENILLQSVWGSVEQSQTQEQLVENLNRIKAIREQYAILKRQAYEQDVARFGAQNVPNPDGGQPSSPAGSPQRMNYWDPPAPAASGQQLPDPMGFFEGN